MSLILSQPQLKWTMDDGMIGLAATWQAFDVYLGLQGSNLYNCYITTSTIIWPSWSKAPVSGTGPKGLGFESQCGHQGGASSTTFYFLSSIFCLLTFDRPEITV